MSATEVTAGVVLRPQREADGAIVVPQRRGVVTDLTFDPTTMQGAQIPGNWTDYQKPECVASGGFGRQSVDSNGNSIAGPARTVAYAPAPVGCFTDNRPVFAMHAYPQETDRKRRFRAGWPEQVTDGLNCPGTAQPIPTVTLPPSVFTGANCPTYAGGGVTVPWVLGLCLRNDITIRHNDPNDEQLNYQMRARLSVYPQSDKWIAGGWADNWFGATTPTPYDTWPALGGLTNWPPAFNQQRMNGTYTVIPMRLTYGDWPWIGNTYAWCSSLHTAYTAAHLPPRAQITNPEFGPCLALVPWWCIDATTIPHVIVKYHFFRLFTIWNGLDPTGDPADPDTPNYGRRAAEGMTFCFIPPDPSVMTEYPCPEPRHICSIGNWNQYTTPNWGEGQPPLQYPDELDYTWTLSEQNPSLGESDHLHYPRVPNSDDYAFPRICPLPGFPGWDGPPTTNGYELGSDAHTFHVSEIVPNPGGYVGPVTVAHRWGSALGVPVYDARDPSEVV